MNPPFQHDFQSTKSELFALPQMVFRPRTVLFDSAFIIMNFSGKISLKPRSAPDVTSALSSLSKPSIFADEGDGHLSIAAPQKMKSLKDLREDKDYSGGSPALVIPCLKPLSQSRSPPKQGSEEIEPIVFDMTSANEKRWKEKRLAANNDESVLGPRLVRNAKAEKSNLLRGVDERVIGRDISKNSYETVPIDRFGMAMMLGMGFQPEKTVIVPQVSKRHYQQAGIGADEEFKLPQKELKESTTDRKKKSDNCCSSSSEEEGEAFQ